MERCSLWSQSNYSCKEAVCPRYLCTTPATSKGKPSLLCTVLIEALQCRGTSRCALTHQPCIQKANPQRAVTIGVITVRASMGYSPRP